MLKRILSTTLLISCFTFISQNIQAQAEQVDRLEIPMSKKISLEYVYNFGENGIIVSTKELRGKSRRDPDRIYRRYNTNLEEKESYEVEVPFRQKYSEFYEADNSLFILHHDTKFGDYTLIELESKNLKEKRTEGKLPSKTNIHEMFCYGKYTVMYGSIGKRKKMSFVLDRETGEITSHEMVADTKKKTFYLLDYYVNENNKQAYALFEICKKIDCQQFRLLTFGEDGSVTETVIDADEYRLVTATILQLDNKEFVISGTYSEKKSTSGVGMYFSKYKNGEQVFFETYNFVDFDNFFSYLSERTQKKIEKKKARKKARGKELTYNIRMVLHDIIKTKDEYVVIGEAYFPTYRTVTRTDANGNTYTTQVFDGYQYSHATIVTFDDKGEKVYDNTFEMYLYQKPFSVKEFIEVRIEDETISLIFADGKYIRTKLFENGEVLEDEEESEIETGQTNDKVRYSKSDLEYWYDDYFISYGYQMIKNKKDKNVDRKRKIYYFQKVKF